MKSYYSFTQNGSGPGYGEIESQVLHCFVRRFAPANIIEIGSGVSTMSMLEAAGLNQRDGKRFPRITCVEPFPSQNLRQRKEVELIPQFCQQVPLSLFDRLSAGDLLFIDSTHAVKVGSDVMRIYLEIMHAPLARRCLSPHPRRLSAVRLPARCLQHALMMAGNRPFDGPGDK